MKTLSLRLDDQVYAKVTELAKADRRSINSFINEQLRLASNGKATFEGRHIIGKLVPAKDIDQEYGLVKVEGINYRYQIDGELQELAVYEVVDTFGNTLTLSKV